MRKKTILRVALLLTSILGFIVYCSTTGNEEQPDREQAFITVVSGDLQQGNDNSLLPVPIVIEVRDASQNSLASQNLNIMVVEGGGSIPSGSTVTTDPAGRASVQWQIGSGYNGLEVTLVSDSYTAVRAYVCAEGENSSGVHLTRTIASFHRVEGVLYAITFYGNYSHETFSRGYSRSGLFESAREGDNAFNCSLFAVFGDTNNYLMGRSFDNPAGWVCLTMITKLNPRDGYASIAPVRLRDIGFGPDTDFDSMNFSAKQRLIDAAYFPPDGVNEAGLIMGLANVIPMPYIRDPAKENIQCQLWVRKVLDQCRTVEEAAALTMRYNITGGGGDLLDVHAILADASGRSIILDPAEGEMKVIPNAENFQVMTNSPVYGLSVEAQIEQCPRFRTIYERLDSQNGLMSSDQALDLLQDVGNQWTEWSAVYLLNPRGFRIAIDFNFDPVYQFYLFPLW